jgi:hypothetical protein
MKLNIVYKKEKEWFIGHIHMKNIILCLLFITVASVSNYSLAQQQLPSDKELLVGYYGRPGAASLGVLGQYTIEELMPKIKAKADEYAQITGNQNVTPAFHLIYGLASSDPGRDKDYILPLSNKKLMEYINAAQSNGFARGEQMVRYYGFYSNKSRGLRKKAGTDDQVPALIDSDISRKAFRNNWARLIQKIYHVDPLLCPKCLGSMRIISFIEDDLIVKKILQHLDLWDVKSKPPPRANSPPNVGHHLYHLRCCFIRQDGYLRSLLQA